jgi:hypothetical protein
MQTMTERQDQNIETKSNRRAEVAEVNDGQTDETIRGRPTLRARGTKER